MLNIYNANNHSGASPAVPSPQPQKKSSYEKYVDPSGEFSGQELKYSFWYVRHRLLLYRIVIGFLIGVAVLTAGFSLFRLGTYLIFGLQESAALDEGLTTFENYTLQHDRFSAKPLQIISSGVFNGGVNEYDLVAEVANPNPRFLATFQYHFTYNNLATPVQTTTLLPGEERPVAALGLTGEVYPTDTALVIDQVDWQRLSNHDYLDPEAWQQERLNFLVTNFEFIPQVDPTGANAEIVRFTLSNQTAYSYKIARFYVGLYLDQSLVGILPLTIDTFKAGESKSVDLRSFSTNLNVNDIRAFPLINVYDPEIYLPPEK